MEDVNDYVKELDNLCIVIRTSKDSEFVEDRIKRFRIVFKSLKIVCRENDIDMKEKLSIYKVNLEGFDRKKSLINASLTADEMLTEANKLQKVDLKKLDNIVQQVDETKQIGAETANKLQQNTEHLRNINTGIEEVNANLKIAGRMLGSYARKLATDKIFLCFTCLLFTTITILILAKVIPH